MIKLIKLKVGSLTRSKKNDNQLNSITRSFSTLPDGQPAGAERPKRSHWGSKWGRQRKENGGRGRKNEDRRLLFSKLTLRNYWILSHVHI